MILPTIVHHRRKPIGPREIIVDGAAISPYN